MPTLVTLTLTGAIADRPDLALIVRLAWRDGQWEGLADAPRWNRQVHAVDARDLCVTNAGAVGALGVAFAADDFVPRDGQPVAARYTLAADGTFAAQFGETPVAGTVVVEPGDPASVNADDCELELWLMNAHGWSGVDWMRTLRVLVEYRGGAPVLAGCITKYGEETIAMPFDAGTLTLTAEGLAGSITVTYPAHPDGPAADRVVSYPLSARIVGPLVGGTYARTDVEARADFPAEGWLRGRLRPMWPVGAPDTRPFRHPGMLTTAEDLARIAAHVRAGDEPWASGFARLRADLAGALEHRPRAMAHYQFIHHSQPGHTRDVMTDAKLAYGCAVMRALTGDARYGAKAAEVLDAYSATLRSICAWDGILGTAYTWPAMIWAAELLRAYEPGWSAEAQARFADLLTRVVYPVGSSYVVNNNWMSWSVCLRMAVAIFTEDRGRFNVAVQDFRDHVADYFDPSGHCRETGRDLLHTQMAIAPLLAAAEMAWHQGLDLYGTCDDRLLTGTEYHIPFIAGGTAHWPHERPPLAVGQWWPMYEMAYAHYGARRGLPTPHTAAAVAALRPETFGRTGWGTLLHARDAAGG